MNKIIILTFLLLYATMYIDGRKMSSRGRSSSSRSSSSRSRSSPHPAPTSLTNPLSTAPKPSLFGWQEKAARPSQNSPSKQSHSYPSSQTGLSGNNAPKQQTSYQENIQRNNAPYPVQQTPQKSPTYSQGLNQMDHSYPVSNGLSGNAKPGGTGYGTGYSQQQSNAGASGVGYPSQQRNGLSGSNAAPPPYTQVDNNRPNNFGNSYHHPQGPPPPYSSFPQNYGGHGGYGYNSGYGQQMPGYFGNYANSGKNFRSLGGTSSALTGVGIAGAGVGTLLTGLALWNLARSTGRHHHTVIYDNRGQPVAVAAANSTEPVVDPILGDLINCTLTINNENVTEILAIPCAIATSFTPDADVKDTEINNSSNDKTECIITVVTKTNREFMTTIPCSILLSTAAENNVTEKPILDNATEVNNDTAFNTVKDNQPKALGLNSDNTIEYNANLNCTMDASEKRDPINPCLGITSDLTVVPLSSTVEPKELIT
ncbi:uncharacterized protein [Battus philenor]|uniref:uncharacterized protein n=1 Tax=Battus philenor TaxID=42288 RepID=UPI0035D0BAB0